MSNYSIADYTFEGLDSLQKPTGGAPFLAYLLGLADKPNHQISDLIPAKRILSWLYELEEQAENAAFLDVRQAQFFSRYFSGGYHPQTPCMVTKAWSPIGAMLERGIEPIVLRRENKMRALATGIWEPKRVQNAGQMSQCDTVDGLFWAIFDAISGRAKEREMWVSVIAQPGWYYDSAIGSLPGWPPSEVEKSGRIIWQRTPDG